MSRSCSQASQKTILLLGQDNQFAQGFFRTLTSRRSEPHSRRRSGVERPVRGERSRSATQARHMEGGRVTYVTHDVVYRPLRAACFCPPGRRIEGGDGLDEPAALRPERIKYSERTVGKALRSSRTRRGGSCSAMTHAPLFRCPRPSSLLMSRDEGPSYGYYAAISCLGATANHVTVASVILCQRRMGRPSVSQRRASRSLVPHRPETVRAESPSRRCRPGRSGCRCRQLLGRPRDDTRRRCSAR